MSRVLFDFLLDSILLDDRAIEDEFRTIPEAELQSALVRYREYVLSNLDELRQEITQDSMSLGAYFGTADQREPSLRNVVRAALYFDRAVLDDPLFWFTRTAGEPSTSVNRFFGYRGSTEIDRQQLGAAARALKLCQPMVGADYLRLAPISLVHEPPKHVPLTVSNNLFAERVPEELLGWFHNRSRVKSMRPLEGGGWGAFDEEELRPTRSIAVEFGGSEEIMAFHLTEVRVEADESDPGVLQFIQWIPEEPPKPDEFTAWITQSVNQHAGVVYRHVATDIVYAGLTRTLLLTDSEFVANLLTVQYGPGGRIEEDLARLGLALDLPFLDDLSVSDIMRIRQTEGEAFQNFRVALQRQLRELRDERDPVTLRRRLEDVQHELTEVQVREVDQSLRRLKRKAFATAVGGIASLATVIPSGGTSLAGVVLAGATAYREGLEYLHEIRVHPAFFLWRLKRAAGQ